MSADYSADYKDFKYTADILVEDKVIIEIKALKCLVEENEAQLLNYLKATGFELGLLINFGQTTLQYKRIIKSINSRKLA